MAMWVSWDSAFYIPVPKVLVSELQLADAAIEEQLEVQTAFREHGARLQQIYDKRQRTDMDIARREQEMKQLQGAREPKSMLWDRFSQSLKSIAARVIACHLAVMLLSIV